MSIPDSKSLNEQPLWDHFHWRQLLWQAYLHQSMADKFIEKNQNPEILKIISYLFNTLHNINEMNE